MPEFLRLSPPVDALQTLMHALPDQKPAEEVIECTEALGRVLAEDVYAPHPLPEFQRSTVDGYAIKARDTFGVSEAQPGYVNLIGEVPMGNAPRFTLTSGMCASIHTGGMLPEGADAVMMLEYTQRVERGDLHDSSTAGKDPVQKTDIEITHATAVGENVLLIGEDVAANQIVLSAGVKIRPAEIGGCMALGITQLRVAKKPIVGIISSGDEVVHPKQKPRPGQVRDVNSYTLAALVEEAGGKAVLYGIVTDNLKEMTTTAGKAKEECEVVIITAGSSASARDITAEAITGLGTPGILVHGVNVHPGKPTILAVCDGKAIIGLPGNPVSALVIAGLFVIPVIDKLLGLKIQHPRPSVMAKISVNIASVTGREDWVAVRLYSASHDRLQKKEAGWMAEPIFGKSNLIFSLAGADGMVRIPPDATGLSAGEMVEVMFI